MHSGMADREDQILHDAAARNCAAVLSLPSAGMLRHSKSRFLGESDGGLVIASAPGEAALIQSLIAGGEPCVVTFKGNSSKTAFAARILKVIPNWQMNEGLAVEALLLAFPDKIKSVQRRSNYRARVSESSELNARVWRLAETADLKTTPMDAQKIRCDLRDLSVGGMGVRFHGDDGKPPKITAGERLRVEISTGQAEPFILEGRMRQPTQTPSGDSIITGVAFKKLESHLEGRRILAILTHIVGQLQREELRRMRLGLAAG